MEAVLLSNRGYTIDELSEIFDVDRDTISNWISRWERYGIEGKDGERVECVHDKKMGKAVQFEMETNEKGIG